MGRRIFPKLIDSIMFNKPLVTVGIPFYNDSRFLPYAIQSVMNQTYQNWELILIDDGSKDNSLEVARGYENDKVRVYSDGTNKGLAARLNELSQLARGEFYARMDADDIMAVNRIERQVKFLQEHPEVDVVGSSVMIIDNNNKIVRSDMREGQATGFIHPTVMGRKNWFIENLYNDNFRRCQDTELWLRTSRSSVFFNISEPLLFYREFGLPSYAKIRLSHNYLRMIYRNYREYGKSWRWYVSNVITTNIKDTAYWLFGCIGKIDLLIGLRKRKQLPKEMWLTDEDLNKALK